MAVASILVGILSGIVSFVLGLIAGHGFLMALGLYVFGGILGMALTLGCLALFSLRRGKAAPDVPLGAARA